MVFNMYSMCAIFVIAQIGHPALHVIIERPGAVLPAPADVG